MRRALRREGHAFGTSRKAVSEPERNQRPSSGDSCCWSRQRSHPISRGCRSRRHPHTRQATRRSRRPLPRWRRRSGSDGFELGSAFGSTSKSVERVLVQDDEPAVEFLPSCDCPHTCVVKVCMLAEYGKQTLI